MSTAFEFLQTNRIFHIATVDGDTARVRPFGFTMKRNDTVYFCTNNTKDVYKQMVKNPGVEISAMATNGSWLRLSGKVVFDATHGAKSQVFEVNPDLLKAYPKGADDETFITFYLTDTKTTLYSFTSAPTVIPLI